MRTGALAKKPSGKSWKCPTSFSVFLLPLVPSNDVASRASSTGFLLFLGGNRPPADSLAHYSTLSKTISAEQGGTSWGTKRLWVALCFFLSSGPLWTSNAEQWGFTRRKVFSRLQNWGFYRTDHAVWATQNLNAHWPKNSGAELVPSQQIDTRIVQEELVCWLCRALYMTLTLRSPERAAIDSQIIVVDDVSIAELEEGWQLNNGPVEHCQSRQPSCVVVQSLQVNLFGGGIWLTAHLCWH